MKQIMILALFAQITGCMFMEPDFLKAISPKELDQVMKAGDIFLVDVHIPEQKHIIGTDQFIPFNNIAKNIGKFPKDKSAPIYIYCKSGPMGNAAAKALHENGYTNLYNLAGGLDAWIKAGYKAK
ncbi:hypothetical protein MNBD_NITROSPINAE02-524 [hydrothermal vent metagenome]|uniref:Rhodanese domain-containing protein n=1 Tax=hydrothermal vent metagenome TaxID=652676 RepID=A0A3B1BP26_9ZZZZ